MAIEKGDEFYIKHNTDDGDNFTISGPYVCTLSELGFIYHVYDDHEIGRRIEHCSEEDNCVKMEDNNAVFID